MSKKVVIIGGGYGGLKAMQFLSYQKDIEIILIDENSYHYLQTDVYDFIANKSNIQDITTDLKSFTMGLNNCSFIKDSVSSFNKNFLSLKSGRDIEFDYLIISTGAVTKFPHQIENLQKFSHGIKSIDRAIEFKHMFESSIYNHIKDSEACSLNSFNIVIAGAGLSGVEIASEMAYIANEYLKTIGIECKGVKIYLIDGNKNILEGMDRYIIKKSFDRLKELGVKIKLGNYLKAIDEEQITLDNSNTIKYDFMIFTGGIKPKLIESSNYISKNRIGQFIVDEYFRVENYNNIFAIGDVAQTLSNNKYMPTTAQTAEQSGIFVARNIGKDIKNKPMKKYIVKSYGVFVALGGKYAVAQLMNIKFSGYSAYLVKKLITNFYKYSIRYIVKKGFKRLNQA